MTAPERFIRWQSIVREQLSSASNTVLGLSTGIIAFLAAHLVNRELAPPRPESLYVASCLLLSFSIAAAVACALTRLNDYRITLKIVRQKDGHSDGAEVNSLRQTANLLGASTWILFHAQMLLFLLGGSFAVLAFILEVIGSRGT